MTDTPIMRLAMGDYEVVHITKTSITLHLGNGVHATINCGEVPHLVKPGMKLTLYTEVPYGQAVQPSIQ